MHVDPSLMIAGVLVLGVLCQWFAWRIKLPAILPLLLTGLLLGPVLGMLHPQQALGAFFQPLVSLSVALILFEGSLTLSWSEVRTLVRPVRNLLTIGAAVSWFGGALGAHYLAGLPWNLALLFGALIIVTGPTVIAPLLRNVRPNRSVASVLKWEGILIDPVGATVAVLVFEAIVARSQATLGSALLTFLAIVVVGVALGLAGGWFVALALHRFWIPDYLREVAILALVLGVFALSNTVVHESGLTAVTAMGILLANTDLKQLREVLYFKERLSVLLISTLFILLAANVTRADLALLSWGSVLLVAYVMFVLRPLGVFLSSLHSTLTRNERIFLGWIAPRGIVAASVSSLFAYQLVALGNQQAGVIAPLIFLVIVGTVTLQSLTAKPLARRLGVSEAEPQGFLLMGAGRFARELAAALQRAGMAVRLVDSNRSNVMQARLAGLEALHGNIFAQEIESDLDISGLGRLLALTENDEANALACRRYVDEFGSACIFQLAPRLAVYGGDAAHAAAAQAAVNHPQLGRLLFAPNATAAWLEQALAAGGALRLTPLTEQYTWEQFQREQGEDSLPLLYVRAGKATLNVVGSAFRPQAGDQLLVLGPAMRREAAVGGAPGGAAGAVSEDGRAGQLMQKDGNRIRKIFQD